MRKIVVVGAGAAGFFAAITAARHASTATKIILIEKSNKVLAKVLISGGGRCNVTHAATSIATLLKGYPRGAKALKVAFQHFFVKDTVEFFENLGVPLKTEKDGRMFPLSNQSSTIANALQKEAEKLGVILQLNTQIIGVAKNEEGFEISLHHQGESKKIQADKLIWATGGGSKISHFSLLQALGHPIIAPVPSLFTFHIADDHLHALAGLSVENVAVNVVGEPDALMQNGALLITHFGLSGPAILKLSAFGARLLHEKNYEFTLKINFLPRYNEAQLREMLAAAKQKHPQKRLHNTSVFDGIPSRLWAFIAQKAGIAQEIKWLEISQKNLNKLINELCNAHFLVQGKTTFKEEFVTAGGIDLAQVHFPSLESKVCKNLFFAGEVVDIDGITGGYNFQAAWTTGFLAGKNAAQ